MRPAVIDQIQFLRDGLARRSGAGEGHKRRTDPCWRLFTAGSHDGQHASAAAPAGVSARAARLFTPRAAHGARGRGRNVRAAASTEGLLEGTLQPKHGIARPATCHPSTAAHDARGGRRSASVYRRGGVFGAPGAGGVRRRACDRREPVRARRGPARTPEAPMHGRCAARVLAAAVAQRADTPATTGSPENGGGRARTR